MLGIDMKWSKHFLGLGLACGIALLFSVACGEATAIPEPVMTNTSPPLLASETVVPSVTSTAVSVPDTPSPVPTSSPTPSPMPTSPSSTKLLPEILNFTARPSEVLPGESVVLSWASRGGTQAQIGGRLPGNLVAEGQSVPHSGKFTAHIKPEERLWHEFELVVSNETGATARQSLKVQIACPYTYFFSPPPEGNAQCPYKPAGFVAAAEQVFEHGRMIWLEGVPASSARAGQPLGAQIFVFYDNGQYRQYADTWTSDQPSQDPGLVPPDGLYQPLRGFGKVWREDESLRTELGWATAPEQAFDGAYQLGWLPYYLVGAAYLRTAEGGVIEMGRYGYWAFAVEPGVVTETGALDIVSFTVDAEDITGNGKRLTFAWETTGAVRANLMCGSSHRFIPWWEVEPSGTLVKEIATTHYANPEVVLTAYDAEENEVSRSITLDWPCEYDYFFDYDVQMCPSYDPTFTAAAEQSFEQGTMLWLKEFRTADTLSENAIFALFKDGTWQWYADTWETGDPEDDPTLVAPEGLYQPVRGFGKVWRENETLRARLGWATAPEQGFEGVWQPQMRESISGVAFIRLASGQIVELYGWQNGSWTYFPPSFEE